jgi:hypothetical protein
MLLIFYYYFFCTLVLFSLARPAAKIYYNTLGAPVLLFYSLGENSFFSKCHELWLRASACARGTQNCLGGESHSGQSKLIERGDVFKTIEPADLRYLIGKRETVDSVN